ncbi:hypothetical protein MGWOODY_Tha2881 [hydrothermal vent metagenome]|uniref:Uncharacterized protein n=1 Tax=hydrothermal vent metagenome TaxID=652676 RepID=A0A160TDX6_9ZZZZ
MTILSVRYVELPADFQMSLLLLPLVQTVGILYNLFGGQRS